MSTETAIERAAELLRTGGVVALPTETVYGLGANALDAEAVSRVYRVKGRPSTSPLIVHVASVEMARSLVTDWPEAAEALGRRFWPGPLTMVLPKRDAIPDIVTAGLRTVGLRIPAHPLTLEVIRRAGVPVAAPSANRFTQLSPTTAEHVRQSLGTEIDMVLDGGPCGVGIESTVVSLVAKPAVLLRPGMISQQELESVIGSIAAAAPVDGAHPSPGMHPRHYSPLTPVVIIREGPLPPGRGAYLWLRHPLPAEFAEPMPSQPQEYARTLYDALHRADSHGLDWIAVEAPPDNPEWAAIRDRIERAAAKG